MTQPIENTPSTPDSSKFFGMSPLPYEEKLKIIQNEYSPKIHKIGIPIAIIHIFIMFLPAIYLLAAYGVWPGGGTILNAVVPLWAVLGVIYFIEPLQYYLALGTVGTYVTFLAGNGPNVRLPTAVATTEVMGIEPGSPEAEVVAGISIIASQWLMAILILIAALSITWVIGILPPVIVKAFDFLAPALFGGMLVYVGMQQWRYMAIAVAASILLYFAGVPSILITILLVFFMIALSYYFYRKGIWVPKKIVSAATEDV